MRPKLSPDTADVWAFLEYLDDVLGRLFDWHENSPLRDNTYIMILSDNGSELFPGERKGQNKLVRGGGGPSLVKDPWLTCDVAAAHLGPSRGSLTH